MVEALKADEIDKNWYWLSPYIESALSHSLGEMTLDDIRKNGVNGAYLFLAFRDKEVQGVATVEHVKYADKSILWCPQVAGDNFNKWIDELWDVLLNLAKEQGAKEIAIHGRRGWLKKLARFGFKEQYTTMAVKL